MSSFDRSNPTDEAKVLLFLFNQSIETEIDPMMDRVYLGHGFLFALEVTNTHVVDLRVISIILTQLRLMGSMKGQNHRPIDKAR
jgi:hypothetical protein